MVDFQDFNQRVRQSKLAQQRLEEVKEQEREFQRQREQRMQQIEQQGQSALETVRQREKQQREDIALGKTSASRGQDTFAQLKARSQVPEVRQRIKQAKQEAEQEFGRVEKQFKQTEGELKKEASGPSRFRPDDFKSSRYKKEFYADGSLKRAYQTDTYREPDGDRKEFVKEEITFTKKGTPKKFIRRDEFERSENDVDVGVEEEIEFDNQGFVRRYEEYENDERRVERRFDEKGRIEEIRQFDREGREVAEQEFSYDNGQVETDFTTAREQFEENLQQRVKQAQGKGLDVSFAGLGGAGATLQEKAEAFNKEVKTFNQQLRESEQRQQRQQQEVPMGGASRLFTPATPETTGLPQGGQSTQTQQSDPLSFLNMENQADMSTRTNRRAIEDVIPINDRNAPQGGFTPVSANQVNTQSVPQGGFTPRQEIDVNTDRQFTPATEATLGPEQARPVDQRQPIEDILTIQRPASPGPQADFVPREEVLTREQRQRDRRRRFIQTPSEQIQTGAQVRTPDEMIRGRTGPLPEPQQPQVTATDRFISEAGQRFGQVGAEAVGLAGAGLRATSPFALPERVRQTRQVAREVSRQGPLETFESGVRNVDEGFSERAPAIQSALGTTGDVVGGFLLRESSRARGQRRVVSQEEPLLEPQRERFVGFLESQIESSATRTRQEQREGDTLSAGVQATRGISAGILRTAIAPGRSLAESEQSFQSSIGPQRSTASNVVLGTAEVATGAGSQFVTDIASNPERFVAEEAEELGLFALAPAQTSIAVGRSVARDPKGFAKASLAESVFELGTAGAVIPSRTGGGATDTPATEKKASLAEQPNAEILEEIRDKNVQERKFNVRQKSSATSQAREIELRTRGQTKQGKRFSENVRLNIEPSGREGTLEVNTRVGDKRLSYATKVRDVGPAYVTEAGERIPKQNINVEPTKKEIDITQEVTERESTVSPEGFETFSDTVTSIDFTRRGLRRGQFDVASATGSEQNVAGFFGPSGGEQTVYSGLQQRLGTSARGIRQRRPSRPEFSAVERDLAQAIRSGEDPELQRGLDLRGQLAGELGMRRQRTKPRIQVEDTDQGKRITENVGFVRVFDSGTDISRPTPPRRSSNIFRGLSQGPGIGASKKATGPGFGPQLPGDDRTSVPGFGEGFSDNVPSPTPGATPSTERFNFDVLRGLGGASRVQAPSPGTIRGLGTQPRTQTKGLNLNVNALQGTLGLSLAGPITAIGSDVGARPSDRTGTGTGTDTRPIEQTLPRTGIGTGVSPLEGVRTGLGTRTETRTDTGTETRREPPKTPEFNFDFGFRFDQRIDTRTETRRETKRSSDKEDSTDKGEKKRTEQPTLYGLSVIGVARGETVDEKRRRDRATFGFETRL